jgi:pimeloyl-ACP methyl ester carboxylesterase
MTARNIERFWFERDGMRCFASLHLPATPPAATPPAATPPAATPPERGVVLCNALGFEGQTAYRSLWHLADRLSESGFAVLRFDYHGCGDSDGSDFDPDRVGAWVESVVGAIDVLRDRAGVRDVQLVGLRFGAALAYLAAQRRPDVSGVAMWWPVLSGAAWARELRAISMLSAASRPQQNVETPALSLDAIEVVGYEFSNETLAAIRAVDLPEDSGPMPRANILVVDRDDDAKASRSAARLTELGQKVEQLTLPGYADFMIDNETHSVVPVSTLESIAQWLEGTAPAEGDPIAVPIETSARLVLDEPVETNDADPTSTRRPLPTRRIVTEDAVELEHRLVGVLSKPDHAEGARPRTGVVMITTGATSRAGPGRLHVRLARAWAALGYSVLRFDLGGAGDSLDERAPESWGQPYDLARTDEVCAAARWLRDTQGVEEVLLFGVCSGAYNAFHAALRGADARSIVLVNPAIYYVGADQSVEESPDKALFAGYVVQRGLVSREKWRRVFTTRDGFTAATDRMKELMHEKALAGLAQLLRARVRHVLERWHVVRTKPSLLVQDLDRLSTGGMNVAIIFAADEPGEHYARAVGGDSFERLLDRSNVDLVRVDGGDHIFSPPGARARLAELATEFAQRWHPTAPASSRAVDSV